MSCQCVNVASAIAANHGIVGWVDWIRTVAYACRFFFLHPLKHLTFACSPPTTNGLKQPQILLWQERRSLSMSYLCFLEQSMVYWLQIMYGWEVGKEGLQARCPQNNVNNFFCRSPFQNGRQRRKPTYLTIASSRPASTFDTINESLGAFPGEQVVSNDMPEKPLLLCLKSRIRQMTRHLTFLTFILTLASSSSQLSAHVRAAFWLVLASEWNFSEICGPNMSLELKIVQAVTEVGNLFIQQVKMLQSVYIAYSKSMVRIFNAFSE